MSRFTSKIDEMLGNNNNVSNNDTKIANIRNKVKKTPNAATDNEKEIAKLADEEEAEILKNLRR